MKSILKKIVLLLCVSALGHAQDLKAFDITVEVKNAENDKGKMFFALYDKEENFLKKELLGEIEYISHNMSVATFKSVPVGVYAISVFHDENDNNALDTNAIGIPNEAFGCSNNAKGFMGPPKWKNAKFELIDTNKTLVINL